MHIIRRRGSETYPSAFAGASASAQMPFAQLGLSADVPFIDGNQLGIPFDTVVYQSSQFGDFEIEGGISVFFVPFGVYVVTLQATIDTDPDQLSTSLQIGSGSASDQSALTIEGPVAPAIALTISGVRFGSETPSPGHVLPVAIIPLLSVVGGGNGNILADFTKLFVWKLTQFQPVT